MQPPFSTIARTIEKYLSLGNVRQITAIHEAIMAFLLCTRPSLSGVKVDGPRNGQFRSARISFVLLIKQSYTLSEPPPRFPYSEIFSVKRSADF